MDKAGYRSALAALGWSHGDAARHLCVSRSASGAWASGDRAVPATIERLLALCVNVPGTLIYIKALDAPSAAAPLVTASAKGKKVPKVWTQAECMAEAIFRAGEAAIGMMWNHFEDQGVKDEVERMRLAKAHARVTPQHLEEEYLNQCGWRNISPDPRPARDDVTPHLAQWFGPE